MRCGSRTPGGLNYSRPTNPSFGVNAKVNRLPAILLRPGEGSMVRNSRCLTAPCAAALMRNWVIPILVLWSFHGYTPCKRSDRSLTLSRHCHHHLPPRHSCSLSHLLTSLCDTHRPTADRSIIIMPPWLGYTTTQQARTDDKVANATLHPQTLHLPIENVFSFLCFATLYFYSHYAFVAHFSIKLRGLVQNNW